MRTTASWNGTAYGAYPEGVAEPVMAKITIPAHKELTWHSHPMPSFAQVLSGEINVEDDNGIECREGRQKCRRLALCPNAGHLAYLLVVGGKKDHRFADLFEPRFRGLLHS